MTDLLGKEIRPGCEIAYAAKCGFMGTVMFHFKVEKIHRGQIYGRRLRVSNPYLQTRRLPKRQSRLTYPQNAIVIKEP